MQACRLPWPALARPPVPMLDVELVIDFLPLFAPKTEFQTGYFLFTFAFSSGSSRR